LIDRLYKEIQDRLDQVMAEAERLRKALVALDPRGGSSSRKSTSAAPRRSAASRSAASAPAKAAAAKATPARKRAGGAAKSAAAGKSSSTRTAPGATKAAVLAALGDGGAKTAGEVAAATGLARGTVSTTLSKLARSGEVAKAARGYSLPNKS
jgi:DNA-binding transcriptional ArsR family regulator